MMTRRGVLVESLKFAGLFAGAAVVFGCGEESGTTVAKPSAETINLDKKQAEAREKAKQAEAEKKK